MKIDITNFKGIIPKVGKHVLPDGNSVLAENCRLGSGMLRPIPTARYDHTVPTGTQSIYRWNDIWMHFPDATRRFCPGTIFGEEQKLYMSAEDGGIYTWTGDVLNPEKSVKTGCPEPTVKPNVSYIPDTTNDSSLTKTSRVYLWTCVNEFGEESAPSPPSDIIDYQGRGIRISGMTTPSSAGYAAIKKKRIYRLTVGDSSSAYLYVGEVGSGSTAFNDTVSDSELGEQLPTEGWHVPDDNLKGLVSLSGGVFAAYNGTEVRCSAPGYPYAWPIDYSYNVEYDIVGLASSSSYLFIMTTGPVYYMSTDDLGSTAPVKMDELCPCVSARSIIPVTGGAVFASNDGLYFVSAGYATPRKISNDYFSITEWRELNPRSMHGAYWNSTLYLAYITVTGERGLLVWSFSFDQNADSEVISNLTTIGMQLDAAFVVPRGELMYVISNGKCFQWEGVLNSKMIATWTSKSYLMQNKTNFSSCIVEQSIDDDGDSEDQKRKLLLTQYLESHNYKIDGCFASLPQSNIAWASSGARSFLCENNIGEQGRVRITIWCNGEEVYSDDVISREPFTLPAGFTGRTWWITLETNVDVRRVAIAESMSELYD